MYQIGKIKIEMNHLDQMNKSSALCETGSFDGTSQYHCDVTNGLLKEMRQFIKDENINLDEYNDNGEKL